MRSYDGKLATLTIEDVMTDDSAEMKVVAENNAGKVESSCKLEVKGNLVIFYKRNNSVVITPANEVCEGYVFTPVCQSFCSGGCLPQCMLGYTPPSRSRPPRADTPWSRHPQSKYMPQCMLGYTPWSRPPWEQTAPPGADPPPLHSACWEIRATSGRYASYWNAYLLSM